MSLPRTIASAVDTIARQAIGKQWNLYAALLHHWAAIVGAEYATTTTPVKISFPKGKTSSEKWTDGKREDGVLHIRLPQGLVMEFTFHTDQIKQRIATYFGYNAIASLAFEPYYDSGVKKVIIPRKQLDAAQASALQTGTQDIADDELRLALQKLGESVFTAR